MTTSATLTGGYYRTQRRYIRVAWLRYPSDLPRIVAAVKTWVNRGWVDAGTAVEPLPAGSVVSGQNPVYGYVTIPGLLEQAPLHLGSYVYTCTDGVAHVSETPPVPEEVVAIRHTGQAALDRIIGWVSTWHHHRLLNPQVALYQQGSPSGDILILRGHNFDLNPRGPRREPKQDLLLFGAWFVGRPHPYREDWRKLEVLPDLRMRDEFEMSPGPRQPASPSSHPGVGWSSGSHSAARDRAS
jgi:hypothetical protein